jgi:hypothetical protein
VLVALAALAFALPVPKRMRWAAGTRRVPADDAGGGA